MINFFSDKVGLPAIWSEIAVVSLTFVLALLLITAVMRSFVNV